MPPRLLIACIVEPGLHRSTGLGSVSSPFAAMICVASTDGLQHVQDRDQYRTVVQTASTPPWWHCGASDNSEYASNRNGSGQHFCIAHRIVDRRTRVPNNTTK
jgi:hypothetical protein